MRVSYALATLAVLVADGTFASAPREHLNSDERAAIYVAAGLESLKRFAPANGANGYTPQTNACPTIAPAVRAALSLSAEESSWLQSRRPITFTAMQQLLSRINIPGFDAAAYFSNHAGNFSALPNIGIAASGGGYRALMNGAGAMAAFDDRTTNSTTAGQLGGLLQSTTYLAGLSGGSWLMGSLFANNFTSVESIIADNSGLWDFTNSILKGPDKGIQFLTTVSYYEHLYDEVRGKEQAGFNTTLTDYWGRALSYQLVNAAEGGPAYTMSSLQNQTFFSNGSVPMPLIIADNRAPDQVLIPSNTTIFEFNPYEMGSWDPTTFGFAPLQYIGTSFTNGTVDSSNACVTGYDNIGFIYGTSSTLFNQIVLRFNTTVDVPSFLENAIQDALDEFGESNNDIADWVNPFYLYHDNTNPTASSRRLTLVDGGEDNQNIPLHPLIQPVRQVDTIFAIDSSADTDTHWPNGSSLVSTYERFLNSSIQNHTAFPSIPDVNTFINFGLNNRPTFFGCNVTNITLSNPSGSSPGPLIVYIPNAPYSYHSNVSTYDLSYNDSQRNAIILNGYNVATRGNSSEASWPLCVGCAILQRSLVRTNTAIPADCETCFTNYCWNGTLNSTTPALYEPAYMTTNVTTTVSGTINLAAPRLFIIGIFVALSTTWLNV